MGTSIRTLMRFSDSTTPIAACPVCFSIRTKRPKLHLKVSVAEIIIAITSTVLSQQPTFRCSALGYHVSSIGKSCSGQPVLQNVLLVYHDDIWTTNTMCSVDFVHSVPSRHQGPPSSLHFQPLFVTFYAFPTTQRLKYDICFAIFCR